MSSPDVSIANLSVARKTLLASNGEKLPTRAFHSPIFAQFADFARKRGERTIRSQTMKIKSRRFEGAGVSCERFIFPPQGREDRRLLLDARVGRGDRLQRVGGHSGVELRDLGRLGDEALIGLLGEFGLDLNRGFRRCARREASRTSRCRRRTPSSNSRSNSVAISCNPFDSVVEAEVKASSCSLENFWNSSNVGVVAVMAAPFSFVSLLKLSDRNDLSMTPICALHNESQGAFLQCSILPRPTGRRGQAVASVLPTKLADL